MSEPNIQLKIQNIISSGISYVFIIALWGLTIDASEAQGYPEPIDLVSSSNNEMVFIGFGNEAGIGVFNQDRSKLTHTLTIPSPVTSLCFDQKRDLIYAAARDNNSRLFVIDPARNKLINTFRVGYHPSDIALQTGQDRLFVSNRFNNDISVVDLRSRKEIERIDVGREPIAIAISPDENLVAVANLLPSVSSLSDYVAAQVSLIDTRDLTLLSNIDLPNGSYNLNDICYSPDGQFIYVTHLIGRYNVLTSQIEKGWINTNALSILNAVEKKYFTTVLLDDLYLGAANPAGMEMSDDGKLLFIALSGTHEILEIDLVKMHGKFRDLTKASVSRQYVQETISPDEYIRQFDDPTLIDAPIIEFNELSQGLGFVSSFRTRHKLQGRGPIRLLLKKDKLYVSCRFSDALEILNIYNPINVNAYIELRDEQYPYDDPVQIGKLIFHDASRCFQQWQSCASCHPGEGRVDALNWDLINDGFGNPKNTKSMLFAHETPPAMATGIRSNAETAVRAGFRHIQFFEIPEDEAHSVDAYLKSLKPVPSPYLIDGKLSKSAERGKDVFNRSSCLNCHSGPYYTNLEQYEMGDMKEDSIKQSLDTPTLIELWRTAPYLHNGKYTDLKDVFKSDQHGLSEPMAVEDINDLVMYLLSL
jgi:YVTN family beta-propeller protein